jgi:hypothetical protein
MAVEDTGSGDEGDVGEGGGEVTYVNGHAVEQTTSGDEPDGDHGDELAAAKAAVKAALQDEGKKAAKESKEHLDKDPLQKAARERGEDGKFVKAEDDKSDKPEGKVAKAVKEPEEESDASQLRKALQERKEAARYKAEAAAEVEAMRTEARTFYQQLQKEKQEVAKEKERLAMLRKDPLRAIRENGWDPEEFILDIANDGTPEGQAKRLQRERDAEIAELKAWREEQKQAGIKQQEAAKQQEKAHFRNQVEQEFLKTAAQRDGAGEHVNVHLVSMYKDDPGALCEAADRVAERYRATTGKEATFGELVEYLEERAAKWYKSMSERKGVSQADTSVTKGKPTPGSATGKKSLSPAGSSERRSLGSPFKDLDGDERLEAAKEAVRIAIHATGERA